MNFHSLARRDLQFLCKKNRIPANLTNVAMAKALEALKTVEGIEEMQEALGIRSSKVNSPELPHIGKKIFTRGVTHGDEPKTQQQQEPSPMPRSHRVTVKTLEVKKMASNEEEVQENLGFQSLNVKSPELPHTARRTSASKAAHREKPSPLHRSCLKLSIALEEEGEKKKVPQILPKTPATRKAARGVDAQSSRRMVKKNEEVQENLGFQSLNVKSPELPHTARRTSARRAAHRENPSPLHRSCLKLSIALEEEGEKKKVPQILPKTPAKRKAARAVEAQSSRRLVKKNEDVECHTKTPKEVEAKGQKAIGVVARRSTRLSSRKALEESVTAQSKSKSSSRKNSAVKMEAFAKEDAGEVKKDLVKYGEVENECEARYENVHEIQQEKGRLHPLSNRVNTKALEATIEEKVTIVDLIEEKAGEKEKEEDKRDLAEKSDSCAVALVEANKEQDKKEESHGYCSLSEVKNGDSISPLAEEVKENNEEVENLCFSSSTQVEYSNIEVENGDSTVALVEGDEKNDEKLQIQISSFSIEMKDSNVETESGVFNVVHVEEEGRNDQEESHELSSLCVDNSIEHCNDQSPENDLVDNSSNIVPTNEAVEDSCAVTLIETNKKDNKKEESHCYSSSSEVKNDDSIAPLVEEVEMNNPEVENLCFSSSTQVDWIIEVGNGNSTVALVEGDEKYNPELEIQDSNVETESDVFNVVHVEGEGRNDQEEIRELSSFRIVDDSSNIVPTNEAVEDSVDNSSQAKLASSALSDNLLCIKVTPFPHEEANETSSGIDEEARKLRPLFTQMTLKEAKLIISENIDSITNPGDDVSTTEASGEIPGEVMESGGVLISEVSVAIGETIDDDLSNAGALSAIDSADAQGTSFESRIPVSSIELCAEISAADSTIEWPDKNANELPVVIKESFEDSITDSSELTANGFVDGRQKDETLKDNFFELPSPVSSAELCSDFLTVDSTIESRRVDHHSENLQESVEDDYLHKLADNESFKISQKTENYQSGSLKLLNPVSCTEPCFKLSTVDSDIDFKEFFGNISSEISGSIDESVKAGFSDEITYEKSVYAETSQDASSEPQIPVPSPAELCVEFSSSEISDSIDESVVAGLPKYDKITYEKSVYAETSQDASSEPQIPVPSPAELCVEFSSTSLETICSPLKLSCESETRSLLEPSIFQTQPSEQVPIATTEMAEEKEETMIKASKKEVFLKGENLELMSLRKLRALYKQMVNGPKTDDKKRSTMIKQQDLECLSRSKPDSNYKQKLNDDITKSEKKRSVIKQQQDLECLSRSKLHSNNKQKLNDEFLKSERKRRAPLKNLNYKIQF
ncbi:probable GPI-anchored adhesin-like protein PGA55 isoform X2 [Phalaenopsis equestris]|uniref:probable GPI-anchored adhesin-like protein PGA55 isoform X2 n=1 Tax=Phalaenopsis equestris TaxID=78828 RepID=UPI0009E3CB56|nr:probable GPI-anchored adhesin-like protein PGA55 isoform X2 [Phalaenopsis equestris]